MARERLGPAERPPLAPEGGDAGLVVSFAVGPSGVGPVMGFGTDDFFPVIPAADTETDHRSVDAAEAGRPPAVDRSARAATPSVHEPTSGPDARRAS